MSTILTTIGIAVLAVLSLIIALILIASAMVGWAASGEPDANGDPERDSGMSEDEIAELNRRWDRGSARSASTNIQPSTGKESHA